MESITSAINVQVDMNDKNTANGILKNLGLNMSTFVNMAIKQLIYTNGLPFEFKNPKTSTELLEALEEGEAILKGKIKTKGYHNVNQMFEDILNDE